MNSFFDISLKGFFYEKLFKNKNKKINTVSINRILLLFNGICFNFFS
ncbi:hypothetical protein J19TS1_07070 [Heyndrickxia oleronia]|nr:hypothetical protein J19TS1_07070 [Heyndrickxia oleronia]